MANSRILFVDDDEDTRQTIADILCDSGYDVDTAPDGPAALALATRNEYRAVLLDYRMPGMNGLDVYRQLRAHAPEMTVALVTGFVSDDFVRSADGEGIRTVIPKPIDCRALLALLDEVKP